MKFFDPCYNKNKPWTHHGKWYKPIVKNKYCMILLLGSMHRIFAWYFRKHLTAKFIERKSKIVDLGQKEGRWELLLNGYEISAWEDEKAREMMMVMAAQ